MTCRWAYARGRRDHIRLVMLVNDVSLRNLIPAELAKGFGFFQSKPASAFSPVAVTPDELGAAWRDGKVHLPLAVQFNGEDIRPAQRRRGHGVLLPRLVAHAAKTRALSAGTIIGSGTVSNKRSQRGFILHRRAAHAGADRNRRVATAFMQYGDRVRIEMFDTAGALNIRRDRSTCRPVQTLSSRFTAISVRPRRFVCASR